MSWDQIPGRAAYRWIYDEWIASNPRQGAVVVEVGVGLGKSLAYLCERLEEAKRDDIIVYAVDAWGGFARNGEQTAMAEAAGGDFSLYCKMLLDFSPKTLERARVVRMFSSEAAEAVGQCELVILDADHTYEAVKADLRAWVQMADWIGGDDFEPQYQGVIDAVTEHFPKSVIEVRHDQGWGSWLVRPR